MRAALRPERREPAKCLNRVALPVEPTELGKAERRPRLSDGAGRFVGDRAQQRPCPLEVTAGQRVIGEHQVPVIAIAPPKALRIPGVLVNVRRPTER